MILNFDPVCTGKHFVITKRACAILYGFAKICGSGYIANDQNS